MKNFEFIARFIFGIFLTSAIFNLLLTKTRSLVLNTLQLKKIEMSEFFSWLETETDGVVYAICASKCYFDQHVT